MALFRLLVHLLRHLQLVLISTKKNLAESIKRRACLQAGRAL